MSKDLLTETYREVGEVKEAVSALANDFGEHKQDTKDVLAKLTAIVDEHQTHIGHFKIMKRAAVYVIMTLITLVGGWITKVLASGITPHH